MPTKSVELENGKLQERIVTELIYATKSGGVWTTVKSASGMHLQSNGVFGVDVSGWYQVNGKATYYLTAGPASAFFAFGTSKAVSGPWP